MMLGLFLHQAKTATGWEPKRKVADPRPKTERRWCSWCWAFSSLEPEWQAADAHDVRRFSQNGKWLMLMMLGLFLHRPSTGSRWCWWCWACPFPPWTQHRKPLMLMMLGVFLPRAKMESGWCSSCWAFSSIDPAREAADAHDAGPVPP